MERLIENSIFGRTRRERFVTALSTRGSVLVALVILEHVTYLNISGDLMYLVYKKCQEHELHLYNMFCQDFRQVPKEHKHTILTFLLSTSSLESDGLTEELKLSTSSDECIPGNYVIT